MASLVYERENCHVDRMFNFPRDVWKCGEGQSFEFDSLVEPLTLLQTTVYYFPFSISFPFLFYCSFLSHV